MNSIATSIVMIPGVVALLLCLLFTYLYEQSRQAYFRAWQIAWAAMRCTTRWTPSGITTRRRPRRSFSVLCC